MQTLPKPGDKVRFHEDGWVVGIVGICNGEPRACDTHISVHDGIKSLMVPLKNITSWWASED